MGSSLLLKCFSLHQTLTIPYLPHRSAWSTSLNQWKFESNIQKLIPFYLLYSFSFLLFNSCSLLVICSSLWLHPGLFHAKQILVSILLIVTSLFTLVVELPLLLYGNEFIAAVNAYITLNIRLSPNQRTCEKSSFFGEIRKFLRKEAFDEAGIVLYLLILVVCFNFFTLPIILVHLNLDPIHLGITALLPGIYFKWSLPVRISVKVFSYASTWVGSQAIGQSIRVLIVLPMGGLAFFQRVFRKTLNQVDLYHGAVQIFMQLRITFAMMNSILKLTFTMYLSTACITFIMCMVTNIKGWRILPPFVYWMSPMLTVCVTTCLLFVLGFGGDLYKMSEEMLSKWKRQLVTTSSSEWDRKVARKSLRMCRRIAIPVGDIGVIDRDIKINYINNMLNFTIDALVTTDKLLK
ncbi:unnamed protein product [Orchesella dallaii]|uniref:Odorant receptor n=1 Tax=Orchesella dallaii TaxID=48710 RepID=A0ABP1RL92_9HEXA